MLVSVLMSIHNNIKYLKTAVDSILSQTHSDLEFVVIDDCSTEPVWDFLHTYNDPRLVLKRNKKNKGLIASLNICLDTATGDYMARQDGDDISLPTRLEEEVKLIGQLKDGIGYVSCWTENMDENGNYVQTEVADKTLRQPVSFARQHTSDGKGSLIVGPAVMYSREVFQKIGYYDEYLYYSEDTNYHIRALKYFDFGIVQQALYRSRINPNSARKEHPNRRRNTQGVNWRQFVKNRADKYPIIKDKSIFERE